MKRRAEHLVNKRDGRREYLRATKLARSIHLALHSVGVDEDWRALELANVVLAALRTKKRPDGASEDDVMLSTTEIGDAVQHVLVVTGQPQAAVAFGAVAAERSRRRSSLALLSRNAAFGDAPLPGGQLALRERRLQGE
ncbi:MAG: hypothetical protein JNK15_25735 [Planctomycetes bacterium]|nr:hypothetical protein [Planctomycetota bacterium]